MDSSTRKHGIELSLGGKVALVTGGSRGIGAATVRLLCEAGARVVFSYRAAAQQAMVLAEACGGKEICRPVQQELRTIEDGQALVEAATAVFGRLDCLIVNHGVWPPHDAAIEAMSATQWRHTLGVNLDSVFGLVQAGAAQMLRQPVNPATTSSGRFTSSGSQAEPVKTASASTTGTAALHAGVGRGFRGEQYRQDEESTGTRGHIILVASTAAQRGEAFHADYAASKGALLSLTKSLSSELGPQGILCNCVAPGWVRTDMSAGTLSDPHASKKALGLIPLGRAAEPEEIAGPIVFLCTPWAGFISGEIWNVNGGAVLAG